MRRTNWKVVVLFLVMAVATNFIVSLYDVQWDLTSDKKYTLSTDAKELLRTSEGPVIFTVLLEGNVPSSFKGYRDYIDYYLSEMARYDRDVEVVYKDPNAGEDANNFRAFLRKQGVDGVSRQVGTKDEVSKSLLYPYISIHDEKGIRFIDLLESLQPNETEAEALLRSQFKLESKILRGLKSLKSATQNKIHVIGSKSQLLAEGYSRDKKTNSNGFVASSGDDIFRNIDSIAAILCVANSNIPRQDLLAIDVAAQRGIPVIWLIDKFNVTLDSLSDDGSTLALHNDINLEDYLFKLGVKVEPQLALDMSSSAIPQVTGNEGGKSKTVLLPYPYHILIRSGDETPMIAKTSNPIHLKYASPITVGYQLEGLNYEPILVSSQYSQVKKSPVNLDFEIMRVRPNPADYAVSNVTLGLEISGKMPRYFGERLSGEERKRVMPYLKTTDIAITSRQIIIGDASFASPTQGRNGKFFPIGYNTWDRQMYEGNTEFLSNIFESLIFGDNLLLLSDRDISVGPLDLPKWQQNRTKYSFILLVLPILILLSAYFVYGFLRKRKYENYKL